MSRAVLVLHGGGYYEQFKDCPFVKYLPEVDGFLRIEQPATDEVPRGARDPVIAGSSSLLTKWREQHDKKQKKLGRQIERQYMDEIKSVNKRLNGIEKAVSKIAGKLDVDID